MKIRYLYGRWIDEKILYQLEAGLLKNS